METKLRSFAHRKPFRPFAVELNSGASTIVKYPEALALHAGTAAYFDEDGAPWMFAEQDVIRIRAKSNGHRR